VRDVTNGEVLTLAFANAEALAATRATGYSHFFSRSRKELWKKGETSGNVQRVIAISVDCDGDAVLYDVVPEGPACHTGSRSCFRLAATLAEPPAAAPTLDLGPLFAVVLDRKENPVAGLLHEPAPRRWPLEDREEGRGGGGRDGARGARRGRRRPRRRGGRPSVPPRRPPDRAGPFARGHREEAS